MPLEPFGGTSIAFKIMHEDLALLPPREERAYSGNLGPLRPMGRTADSDKAVISNKANAGLAGNSDPHYREAFVCYNIQI